MIRTSIISALAAAPLLAGCNAAATAPFATVESRSGAFTCEIGGRGINYEAVVSARSAISGDYRFEVDGRSGGNSTSIRQGGPFEVGAGERVTLGMVQVGGSPSIRFQVTVNGETVNCNQAA